MKIKNIKALFVVFSTIFLLFACKQNGGENNPSTNPDEELFVEGKVSQFNEYSNPIHPIVGDQKKPTYIADPFVVRDGNDFYLYCTQTDVYTNASSANPTFIPGPIWKSSDMVNWVYYGNVFAEKGRPTWGSSGAGVWAPTVLKVGNKWNFYYSLSTGGDENPGIGVASADNPGGPYVDHGKLFNSNEIGVVNSIDPYVFYDENNLYMVFGSFGGDINLIELEADGLSLKGGIETQREEKVHLAGGLPFSVEENYEASFIFKRGRYYYLLLSVGTCISGINSTYRVVCAKSENVKGPYKDSKGREIKLKNTGDIVVAPSKRLAMGTGHCCVMPDDGGNYWLYYHGYNVGSKYESSRVLYLDKLVWDRDTLSPRTSTNLASNEETLPGPYLNIIEG